MKKINLILIFLLVVSLVYAQENYQVLDTPPQVTDVLPNPVPEKILLRDSQKIVLTNESEKLQELPPGLKEAMEVEKAREEEKKSRETKSNVLKISFFLLIVLTIIIASLVTKRLYKRAKKIARETKKKLKKRRK